MAASTSRRLLVAVTAVSAAVGIRCACARSPASGQLPGVGVTRVATSAVMGTVGAGRPAAAPVRSRAFVGAS